MSLESAIRGMLTEQAQPVEEAKKISNMQIHTVLAKTKNAREGLAALKKAFRVNDKEAKQLLDRAMNEGFELQEEDSEENEMFLRQLAFIKYACDEISECIKMTKPDQEEWWQNKLSSAYDIMKSLHAYMEGGKRMNGDEEEEMDEAYSPMHVKQAIGIATDKRYKGGNMTGAVAAIEKLKKGLSNHPQVRAVLKRVNEDKELEEAVNPAAIEKSMRKALKDRGNYKNGKVNWNFIDADVFMDLNPEKAEVKQHYRVFDQVATKLTKELNIKEETDLDEAKDFVFRFATSQAGKDYLAMKAKQRQDMNQKNDPGASKAGLALSVHDMEKAKKKAKAKLGRIPSRARYGGSSKYDHNTGKLQYGKPNLPENVELDEGINQKKFADGAKAMKAYAMKHGGVDKADFMKVADSLARISRINLLQAGQELSRLNRLVDSQDTDVRERIYIELKKVGLVESLQEKSLTPAEKKKREEIAQAIEKDQPNMPMDQKMAIATAQAKKVAEAYNEPQGQARRMSSPLQKARMDKEKADRDASGKLKKPDAAAVTADKEKNKRISQGDKEKLSMVARMMNREKAKRHQELARKARAAGDHDAAAKHEKHARSFMEGAGKGHKLKESLIAKRKGLQDDK